MHHMASAEALRSSHHRSGRREQILANQAAVHELMHGGADPFDERAMVGGDDHGDVLIAAVAGEDLVHYLGVLAIEPGVRIFYLDTDVLFQETYETRDRLVERYGFEFERYHNITLEEQARLHGDELWKSAPDQCCAIRKVEPLKRALGSVDAWITGVRREQAPTRANAKKVEWDEKFGLVKANPLADWSLNDVWSYIHANDVPYNPLHDQNYPSIGCTHCTRPVMPGDDPRAGRWAGQDKTECGLHPAEAK
jgi:phosphoadenosine phosphosulfate reductase